jgi:phosphatidylglycerophosphatase A
MTPAHWIASAGGIGRAPAAPGTAASFAALLVGAAALWIGHFTLPVLALTATLIGLWAVHATREAGDPGWIVIDEVAGQWIALLGLPRVSWAGLIAAFVLFRFFDITKPGPVGWADRRHGATGVMADDVVAGLISAALLFTSAHVLPALSL